MSTSSAVMEVVHLRKSFGPMVAVDDMSFDLAAGRSIGIVGESGSGKSTTARMLVGLERPDSGTVSFTGEGKDAGRGTRARRARARRIQMVAQDPYLSLDPRVTPRQALERVIRLHFDLPAAERRERAQALLDQVNLGAREADALPRGLSGGQRQRVAIARALAVSPRVLVLDEPTSALDVSVQAQILALLRRIRAEQGISFVFISHDLAVVKEITDELIVMYRGRVVEAGPTREVLRRPSHDYTRLLLDSIPRPGWDPESIGAARRALAAATVPGA
ncbi:MAG TPA: ATP-binding cassette domain-containing protein [Solirubrobacteraceae bacterium]|nr:ATP-binding cassette domain-containing protein [Solirubrobacteraceae bacterium]